MLIMKCFRRNHCVTEIAYDFYGTVIGTASFLAHSLSAGMVGGGIEVLNVLPQIVQV